MPGQVNIGGGRIQRTPGMAHFFFAAWGSDRGWEPYTMYTGRKEGQYCRSEFFGGGIRHTTALTSCFLALLSGPFWHAEPRRCQNHLGVLWLRMNWLKIHYTSGMSRLFNLLKS